VELVVVPGSPNVVRAVASNSMPMGRINPDHVIAAIEKGARIRVVSGIQDKIPQDLMDPPEIKSGADLKGKTIAVSTLTGGTTAMVEEVLEKAYGLKRSDYKYLVVGTSADRYAALKGGSVQATIMGAPFNLRAAQEGFTKLMTLDDILGPIQFIVDFAHQDYIRDHRAEVVHYLQSTIEATEWLFDPKEQGGSAGDSHDSVEEHARDRRAGLPIHDRRLPVLHARRRSEQGRLGQDHGVARQVGPLQRQAAAAMGTFMDSSIVQEAQRRAGYRPSQRDRSGNVRGSADTR
jgi:hypothetical protein